ncbi:MAG: PH domain-containing protein [Enterobacterales bacterium]|nr:PH domain-containing protein [Enterobacterales bacterium]
MIDFQKSEVFKLKPIELDDVREDFHRFLIESESIFAAFKTVRDQLVFTNKRIIAANVQGLTGSKVDYTSIPYNKIQAFSVESSGTFDRDCEIEIYISSIGKVAFEIKGSFDLIGFNAMISEHVLG